MVLGKSPRPHHFQRSQRTAKATQSPCSCRAGGSVPAAPQAKGGTTRQPAAADPPPPSAGSSRRALQTLDLFPRVRVLARRPPPVAPSYLLPLMRRHTAIPTRRNRRQTRTSPSNQNALLKSAPLRLVLNRYYWSTHKPIIRSANEFTSRFLGRLLGSADAMIKKAGTWGVT